MARKTIYCARAYWRRGGQLRAGPPHQFLNAERARLGGEILAGSADGVAVFSVDGHPDTDFWEDPVILATHGDVPGEPDTAKRTIPLYGP